MINRLAFAGSSNFYRFMGSKMGQGIQTAVLSASAVCAISEIARAILISPATAISPAFYGASVLLAWSGKKAASELAKYQGVVHKAVTREEEESRNIASLLARAKETDTFLEKALTGIPKLQLEQAILATSLTDYTQDVKLHNKQLKDSEARILKMDKIFDEMISKISALQLENRALKNNKTDTKQLLGAQS
ncbi:MAG: hypothetical protein K2Y01_05650 [Rhabdochlamydiaceae bacterium]|nr:hypothetical protein [Rhabdochlamydiaceae bacterium]